MNDAPPLTESEAARIIRRFCFGVIRSKDGMTLDTASIDCIYVAGIDLAAAEIARRAAALSPHEHGGAT